MPTALSALMRHQRLIIFLFLTALVVMGFWTRIGVFRESSRIFVGIDEIVYCRMAKQVSQDWREYHTIPFGHELKATREYVPDYFFQPLFKHPPTFTFLVAGALKLFGLHRVSAATVPVLFGVLLIPLTYLIGSLFWGRLTGLLAAVLVYIDPITIMCSQKIWPDTTLAFFMVLTLYLFIRALRSGCDIFFVYAGLALGTALLTKYPAALVLMGIMIYAFLYQRELFRNKRFVLGLFVVPVLLLLPWLFWNYLVYGLEALSRHAELRDLFSKVLTREIMALVLVAGGSGYWFLYRRRNTREVAWPQALQVTPRVRKYWPVIIGLFFLILLRGNLACGFVYNCLPIISWHAGFFNRYPAYFYFSQLIEYSLVYALGFFFLLTFHPAEEKEIAPIRLVSLVILIFFTAWGGYQSRYILPLVPLLLILGTRTWLAGYRFFARLPRRSLSLLGRTAWVILLVFVISRTLYINATLSYTNDMCYF